MRLAFFTGVEHRQPRRRPPSRKRPRGQPLSGPQAIQTWGGRATVLVFVAADCQLARLRLPLLADLAREPREQGARSLGLDPPLEASVVKFNTAGLVAGAEFLFAVGESGAIANSLSVLRRPTVCMFEGQHRLTSRVASTACCDSAALPSPRRTLICENRSRTCSWRVMCAVHNRRRLPAQPRSRQQTCSRHAADLGAVGRRERARALRELPHRRTRRMVRIAEF